MQAQEDHTTSKRRSVRMNRSLHLSVMIKAAQIKTSQQSVVSSQSALDATQASYDLGSRNLVDVLIAKRIFHQARRNIFNARYDYIINLLKLKRATRTLSGDDLAHLIG